MNQTDNISELQRLERERYAPERLQKVVRKTLHEKNTDLTTVVIV